MKPDTYTTITQWGLGGMDTLNNPQDIADNALADALNVTFDRGYPEPRGGSRTVWTKPTGETNAPLNMFAARASDGTNYAVAVYAPNFYLRDEQNNQWIKINQGYTPSVSYIQYPYGYANWNAGLGNDVLYACNGYEDFVKWPIALTYLSVGAASTDTTLTVISAKAFPASGTLVVKSPNLPEVVLPYSSFSNNVFSLNENVGVNLGAGSAVTLQIATVALNDSNNPVRGKIVTTWNSRLVVANGYGKENYMWQSRIAAPEDFAGAASDGTTDGPFEGFFADGYGAITGVDDLGEYLALSKQELMTSFHF